MYSYTRQCHVDTCTVSMAYIHNIIHVQYSIMVSSGPICHACTSVYGVYSFYIELLGFLHRHFAVWCNLSRAGAVGFVD